VAPRLTGKGFKILLDLVLSAPPALRVAEVPARFRPRAAGESKLDVLVAAQFLALLLDKLLRGTVPLRFVAFATVGALGVLVHLAVLSLAFRLGGLGFGGAQAVATIVAMVCNFQLNNQITYRDHRLRGARVWGGLALFMAVCGLGGAANIGIARTLYLSHTGWTLSGATGAVIGINPFDQPDVEASKVETRKLTSQYEASGSLPPESPFIEERGIQLLLLVCACICCRSYLYRDTSAYLIWL